MHFTLGYAFHSGLCVFHSGVCCQLEQCISLSQVCISYLLQFTAWSLAMCSVLWNFPSISWNSFTLYIPQLIIFVQHRSTVVLEMPCTAIRGHPFMTSKKIGFLTPPSLLSTCVHMSQKPSPLWTSTYGRHEIHIAL